MLIDTVRFAIQLFDSVGLTINVNKFVLVPSQKVEFLGITLNSSNMTATLPSRKRETALSNKVVLCLKEAPVCMP